MSADTKFSIPIGPAARALCAGATLLACGCTSALAAPTLSVTTTIDATMSFSSGVVPPAYEVINEAGYSTALPGELPNDDDDEQIDATASISFAMPLATGVATASEHEIQAQTATSYPDLLVGVSASTFYAAPGNKRFLIAPHSGVSITGSSTINVDGIAAGDTVDAATEAFLDIYTPGGSLVVDKPFMSELQSGGSLGGAINLAYFNPSDVPLYAYYTSYVYFTAELAPVPEAGTREMALLGMATLGLIGGLRSRRC